MCDVMLHVIRLISAVMCPDSDNQVLAVNIAHGGEDYTRSAAFRKDWEGGWIRSFDAFRNMSIIIMTCDCVVMRQIFSILQIPGSLALRLASKTTFPCSCIAFIHAITANSGGHDAANPKTGPPVVRTAG